MSTRKHGNMTAAELMAELAADPAYQADIQEQERKRQTRVAKLRAEQAPLLHDLRKVGFELTSVWDFVNRANDYQAAYPVLVQHLQRPYHENIREGIARALTAKDARSIAWCALRDAFIAEPDTPTSAKFALANALAELFDANLIPDVLALATNPVHGKRRAILIDKLARFNRRDNVRDALESLIDDPDVGERARVALSKYQPRRKKIQ